MPAHTPENPVHVRHLLEIKKKARLTGLCACVDLMAMGLNLAPCVWPLCPNHCARHARSVSQTPRHWHHRTHRKNLQTALAVAMAVAAMVAKMAVVHPEAQSKNLQTTLAVAMAVVAKAMKMALMAVQLRVVAVERPPPLLATMADLAQPSKYLQR